MMAATADFPVKSLCSVLNFRSEERKVLGWARYCVCFIDAAMLIHFLSATFAFLEARHISLDSSKTQLRFIMTITLAAMYSVVFFTFFATYCCVKDGFDLIRVRLGLLLSSGLANLMFLASIFGMIIYFKGEDHFLSELSVDSTEEADIAWVSVLILSGATLFMSLLAGVFSINTFRKIRSVAVSLHPLHTYVSFSPESPYSSYWKPSRRYTSSGESVRSPLKNLYPHRALITAQQSPKKATHGHHACIEELKTALPNRKEDQKRTVL